MTSSTDAESQQQLRIIFDLDNTLYSFNDTGLDKLLHDNINAYIQTHMSLTEQEAQKISTEYYAKYGLTVCGLATHHNVDAKHYCDMVHTTQTPADRVSINKDLNELMTTLQQGMGHNLWVMTNADIPHTLRMLSALGILHFFMMPKADGTGVETDAELEKEYNRGGKIDIEAADLQPVHNGGRLKAVDCFAQWNYSSPKMESKPLPLSYDAMIELGEIKEDEHVVMIEDSMVNLQVPLEKGWETVWVSHGRDEGEEGSKHAIIPTVLELLPVIRRIMGTAKQKEEERKKKRKEGEVKKLKN